MKETRKEIKTVNTNTTQNRHLGSSFLKLVAIPESLLSETLSCLSVVVKRGMNLARS